MKESILKIMKLYENYGGRVSLIRFEQFINLNLNNKKTLIKLNNLIKQFNEEMDNMKVNNNIIIKKDYYNFRNYVFNYLKNIK